MFCSHWSVEVRNMSELPMLAGVLSGFHAQRTRIKYNKCKMSEHLIDAGA